MSRRVLIVFWWLVIAESRAVSGEQCHPPSLETCTRDLLTSAADFPNVNWTEIQQIRENNCSLNSSGCQEVFCLNSTTLSTTKGRIAWQPTTVGYRRFNLCPFAHTEKVYAFRDCLVSTNQTISPTINWTQEDTSECPLPPFSMEIEKIYNKIHLRRMYTKCYCSIILTSLSYALKVRLYYSDDPVLSEDHLRTMKICVDWVTNCSSYSILSTDVLWNASDLLLNEDFIGFWDQGTGVRFLSYLSWIFRTNESSGQEHDFFNGSNIYVYERMVGGNISFQFPVDPDDQITATVNAIAPEGTVISNTGSFLIKFSRIPYNISNSFGLYMPGKPDNLDGEYKMFGPLFYIQFQAKSRLSNEAGNTANKSISVNVTFQGPDLNSVRLNWETDISSK